MARALALIAALSLLSGAPLYAQDDMDDVLGGFDDEDAAFEIEEQVTEATPERIWDLSGSIEVSGSYNLRSHDSATGANYKGLQRLRSRLNLQLDVDLPRKTKLRLEGWGFYDAAYDLRGQERYTREVLDHYEFDAEIGEAWLQTELLPNVDLKIGRQIAIWGHSETLRVLDVLNPLDNREPGRVDLEDLRRPLGMIRVDAYEGPWSVTALAIPELRFDRIPVVGSDFFPVPFEIPTREPKDIRDPEFALAVNGVFSGLDLSFHGAWFHNDTPRFRRDLVPSRQVHDRLWLVGTGGAKTTGSWLWKYELAYVDGLGFFNGPDQGRVDALFGFEYYGITDTTLVVEAVNRTLLRHEGAMRRGPDFVRRNSQEVAVRLSHDRMNNTLHFLALGVLLGWDGQDGSIFRFDVSYDVRDALTVGVGILLYQTGDLPALASFARNDRLIFQAKWSF